MSQMQFEALGLQQQITETHIPVLTLLSSSWKEKDNEHVRKTGTCQMVMGT